MQIGYLKTWGETGIWEADVLGCVHCFATIAKKSIDKPKNQLTLKARCFACDGYLCPECGLAVQLHGHGNPDYPRTWPHHLWLQRGIDETYRREQNAKMLGV